jgi:type I restriction enzyme R subunit
VSNQDIAASIIGFIRQQALGSALIPYDQRVDRALQRVLASQPWTPPQRQWLDRIGKQLKAEVVVDRDALDQGQFKARAAASPG